jgi:hypothetical protein
LAWVIRIQPIRNTLIVARILAFPTQIDLPDNEYMVEDLGLFSGTKPKPSCYDFSLDLLYPNNLVTICIQMTTTAKLTTASYNKITATVE